MIDLGRRPDGRRHRILRRARTRAEAQRKLREMRAELDDQGSIVPANRTVAEAVDDYIVKVRQPDSQSVGTRNKDRMLANAVVKHLGARRTSELAVQDVEAFLESFASGQANASGKPVSKDYVRRLRSFISRVLKNDMRLGLLHRDIAELATLPRVKVESRPRRALTVEEWRRLYEAATGTTKIFIDLCGRHGLRPQEARALTWSDVDLGENTISVVSQMDSTDQPVGPKTKASTRTVQVHDELVDRFRQLRVQRASGANPQELGKQLIIRTRNGTPVSQENQRRSLLSVCWRANVQPITPYELRHTAITHQVEACHPISHIAEWAGTSEKMIFEFYRHKLVEVSHLRPPDL